MQLPKDSQEAVSLYLSLSRCWSTARSGMGELLSLSIPAIADHVRRLAERRPITGAGQPTIARKTH